MIPSNIRVKALLLAERNKDEIFVSEFYDKVKQKTYYRPIGGTVEFGESTIDTLKREIDEEIGERIVNEKIFQVLENMFTYEGQKGHEIVFVYKGEFVNTEMYDKEELWMTESNNERIKCLWIKKQLFKEQKLNLVPKGLAISI